MPSLKRLLNEVRACTHCATHLPLGPRPVLRVSSTARILIVGQAPGTRVHESGIPWNDPSGDRLREWMDLDRDRFYDESLIAIVPMGFCYPGKGKGGDLPPRPECAPLWHDRLLAQMPSIELTLLIGAYAQGRYLGDQAASTLTDTVRRFRQHLPRYLPLVHPSPRNKLWLKKNPWFERDVVSELRRRVRGIVFR